MSDDYKQQINDQIKASLNDWIAELKTKEPALLLTKQWNVLYPRGFHPGNNLIPIVTDSKKGKYLVGELNIFLPDTLELDLNNVELVLKNEPYKPLNKTTTVPTPIDEPLDLLNEILSGINDFLQQIALPEIASNPITLFPQHKQPPAKISILHETTSDNAQDIKQQLLTSPALPEWFKTIESNSVKGELAQKIAESFIHYQKQTNRNIDFKEFFEIFTAHLKKQHKLHHYCKYKAKPVQLDSNNWCTENFCSKKPYNAECNQNFLKFGELQP